MVTAFQRGLTGAVGQRPVRTIDLVRWKERIEAAMDANRRAVRYCFVVGCILDSVAVGLCVVIELWLAARGRRGAVPSVASAVGGGVCVMMFLVALLTKPAGRADTANQIIESGFREAPQGNPVVGIVVMIIMLTALFGSYCLIESMRRARVRRKLSKVDPCEMARIMAQIAATPTGVPVQYLLKANQRVDALRGPVAALMLDGWVVLQERGRVLEQRAASNLVHGWKHPLADIFGG